MRIEHSLSHGFPEIQYVEGNLYNDVLACIVYEYDEGILQIINMFALENKQHLGIPLFNELLLYLYKNNYPISKITGKLFYTPTPYDHLLSMEFLYQFPKYLSAQLPYQLEIHVNRIGTFPIDEDEEDMPFWGPAEYKPTYIPFYYTVKHKN